MYFFLIVIISSSSFTQPKADQYIPVELYEKRLGKAEIEILLKNNKIYIPIIQLFKLLRIKIDVDKDKELLSGFIINPEYVYVIDIKKKYVLYKKIKSDINELDIIITENDYYFIDDYYFNIFGLDLKYDEKKLQITLKSNLFFPELGLRQRQKLFQREISRETITPSIDYGRDPSIFYLGRLNYNLSSSKSEDKDYVNKYHFDLGGQLLWGDYQVSIKGMFQQPIKERDIYGFIRYPFFNTKTIRQIILGDIRKKSFIGGSIIGLDITNIPAERRIKFGETQIITKVPQFSEYYAPGIFDKPIYFFTPIETTITQTIPLYFGYNEYSRRIYDYYGVEKKLTEFIIIPQGLIPPGEIDYRATIGKIRRFGYPLYSAFDLKYGATDRISFGAGLEYLNQEKVKTKLFPYTYSIVRFFNNFYGTLEFSPFIFSQIDLTFQSLDYKIINLQYNFRQLSPIFNPRGIKNTLNIFTQYPIIFKHLNINLSARYTNNNIKDGTESNSSFNIYLGSGQISTLYSINHNYSKFNYSYKIFREGEYFDTSISSIMRSMYSTIDINIRATSYSVITAGGMYNHYDQRLNFVRMGLILPIIPSVSLSFIAERNLLTKDLFAVVNLNIRPKYFNSSTTVMKSRAGYFISERITGEIITSSRTFEILFQNKTQSQYGYFITSAFLDTNKNGKKDKGETNLKDVSFNFGKKSRPGLTTVKRYSDFKSIFWGEQYRDYILSVKAHTLDDPLLVPMYEAVSAKSEPNKIKNIEFPIVSGGIINGTVVDESGNPVGGISLIIFKNGKVKRVTATNSQGEFEFPAVSPGTYQVSIDYESLKSLDLISEPSQQQIEITGKPEEAYVSISFTLKRR